MTTAREFWRPIIGDFNPVGQPRPEDVRRFFVDRSAGDPARSIVQMLTLNLENNAGGPRPYRGLVTGHVGSGKTSELLRLGTELGQQFFVVVFDAETTLDLDTANHFELLLGMGFAVHAAAQVAGLNPAKKHADALVKSLAKFVRKYEERKGFSLNVEQVLKHVFAFVVIGGAAAAGGPPAAVAAGAAVIGANEIFKATRLELNVKDELVKTLELPPNRQEVTVIALIHWRGTKLPRHRVKLYSQAAETLTDQWMSRRRVSPEGWNVQETLNLLLPAVAYHLHGTQSSGVIGEEGLHRLLVQTLLQHEPGLGQADADSRAATFRRNVSEFSGIFLERGLDRTGHDLYGFLHPTFQEYFAARCLVERWQREGEGFLRPLLHDPRWTEVILLAAGHLGELSSDQATRFVATILAARSAWESLLHRDLMLAARSLADDVAVDATLRRAVVVRLVELCLSPEAPESLRDDTARVLGELGGAAAEEDTIDLLNERAPSAALARLFGRLAVAGSTSAVSVLRTLASSNDEETVVEAVRALAKVGQLVSSPEFLPVLLRMTEMSPASLSTVISTFAVLGEAAVTPSILSTLRRMLADPAGRTLALLCLSNLLVTAHDTEIIANDSEMIDALTQSLADESWLVRALSVSSLSRLRAASTTSLLCERIPTLLADPNHFVRYCALSALEFLGASVTTPLIVRMVIDQLDLNLAGQTARTPAALAASAPRNGVSSRLSDQVGQAGLAFRASAQALGRLAERSGSTDIIRRLLDLCSHERAEVRAHALLALGVTSARDEVVAAAIAGLSDPAAEVRAAAATMLGEMKDKDVTWPAAGALRQALSDDDAWVRAAAAAALGDETFAATDPSIRDALLERVDDPDPSVRLAAVKAITRCGALVTDAALVDAVSLHLEDPDADVGVAVAEALRALGSPAARLERLGALAERLRRKDRVGAAAAETLKHLSTAVAVADQPHALSLFASLAQRPDAMLRDVGYVGLRNLLATEAIQTENNP